MLDILKIYMYNVQMFMFKRYLCLLPDIFKSFFCKNVDITGRETQKIFVYLKVWLVLDVEP